MRFHFTFLGSTDSGHMARQSVITSAMTLGPSSQCPGLWRTLHILTIIIPEAWGSDGDLPHITGKLTCRVELNLEDRCRVLSGEMVKDGKDAPGI